MHSHVVNFSYAMFLPVPSEIFRTIIIVLSPNSVVKILPL